jgi:hypothetical protein
VSFRGASRCCGVPVTGWSDEASSDGPIRPPGRWARLAEQKPAGEDAELMAPGMEVSRAP